MIHVAITRRVMAGREAEFEAQIGIFFTEAEQLNELSQAYLIRPIDSAKSREYGILRSFEDEESMESFYRSDLYQEWNEAVHPLVEGEPERRELHGLEAFFRTGGAAGPPPRWKMFLLTWLAVTPTVYIFGTLVPIGNLTELLPTLYLPVVAQLLIGNLIVVASLTWVLMPLLTKVFRPWLLLRR